VDQKLFGYDFTIECRPRHLNVVADALSRCGQPDMSLNSILDPFFQLFADLRNELSSTEEL
jgi:hypothetical protein